MEGVDDLAGFQIQGHRVDGEIPLGEILEQRAPPLSPDVHDEALTVPLDDRPSNVGFVVEGIVRALQGVGHNLGRPSPAVGNDEVDIYRRATQDEITNVPPNRGGLNTAFL